MKPKSFINTRARFQRLGDAKLFSGWIRTLSSEAAVVTLRRVGDVSVGDQFAFQAFGPSTAAVFRAVLESNQGTDLNLKITSPIHLLTSKEQMRVITDGMAGLLVYEGREYDVMVVDLSTHGAAIIGEVDLEKGDKVQLSVDSAQGQAVCDGEVVYCKDAGNGVGQNRLGLSIKPQNRIDQARWQKLMHLAA